MKKKYVIYTSLTGGYDTLPQYNKIHPEFDYICFTNDYEANSKIGQWVIKPIPILSSSNIILSRFSKLCPHKVLKEYEYSIWLDSNLKIISSQIYDIFLAKIKEGGTWYGIKHPLLDCIYEDAKKCLLTAKGKFKEIKPQVDFLIQQKYPKHFGLFENNMIIRSHNNPLIIKINEMWWDIFNRFSKRDQLSLYFVFWKMNFTPGLIFNDTENTHNSSLIEFSPHISPNIKQRIINKLTSWENILLMRYYKYKQ